MIETLSRFVFAAGKRAFAFCRPAMLAAPLLAPVVEEGWEETEIARLAVQRYLEKFSGIDTLVLGCTHYPLLERAFNELTPPEVKVLNPAP